jgi:uncharacterized membrane protein YphA (DoxX/SURF4 family)
MNVAVIFQILIALGIFNVWFIRRNRPTAYRPGDAVGIEEEFRRYGFPSWMWKVVGTAKVTLAILLLVGIVVPGIAPLAAGAMGLLMIAAIASHLRVGDPLVKSMPAFVMLLLCIVVVVYYQ